MNITEETLRVCTHLIQGFSRQETMVLTDITSSRLAYLDRSRIIVPKKYGNPKKPYVVYSWVQVIQLRAITHLKQKISLVLTKKIVTFLDNHGFEEDWNRKHLVIADEDVFVSEADWSGMSGIMQAVASKNDGQFVVVVFPQIERIVSDIRLVAANSDAIDMETFELRVKGASLGCR
jgi:hypothetical protein